MTSKQSKFYRGRGVILMIINKSESKGSIFEESFCTQLSALFLQYKVVAMTKDADLQVRHQAAGHSSEQASESQLVEDDHRQAEKQHQKVQESQASQDAVPSALQVRVVPHGAHQRQVAHHAHREDGQGQQHKRVSPVRAVGHGEEQWRWWRRPGGRRRRRGVSTERAGAHDPRGREVPAWVLSSPWSHVSTRSGDLRGILAATEVRLSGGRWRREAGVAPELRRPDKKKQKKEKLAHVGR